MEESDKEAIEAAKEGKPFKINIISRLIREFAKNNMPEKNFIDSLQKELDISLQTAQKISEEIIIKIVPLLEKVPEEKLKNRAFVNELSKRMESEIEPQKILQHPEIKNLPNPPSTTLKEPSNVLKAQKSDKGQKTIKNNKVPQKTKRQISKSSTPDKYREPIK